MQRSISNVEQLKFATMEKAEIKKQVRSGIVGVLACLTVIFTVCEPADEDKWMQEFLLSKAIAAVIGATTYVLAKRWGSKGLLPDLQDDEEI